MKNNKKNIIIISVSIIIVLILVIIGCMIIKSNNNKEINNFNEENTTIVKEEPKIIDKTIEIINLSDFIKDENLTEEAFNLNVLNEKLVEVKSNEIYNLYNIETKTNLYENYDYHLTTMHHYDIESHNNYNSKYFIHENDDRTKYTFFNTDGEKQFDRNKEIIFYSVNLGYEYVDDNEEVVKLINLNTMKKSEEYKNVEYYSDDIILVTDKNNNKFIINSEFEKVKKLKDSIRNIVNNNLLLNYNNSSKKFELVNYDGKIVLNDDIYHSYYKLHHEYIEVCNSEKCGILNTNTKEMVVPFVFELETSNVGNSKSRQAIEIKNNYFFKPRHMISFSNGESEIKNAYVYNFDGKQIIDSSNIVELENLNYNYYLLEEYETYFSNSRKIKLLNYDGDSIISTEAKFLPVYTPEEQPFIAYCEAEKNNACGIKDFKGNTFIDFKYEDIQVYNGFYGLTENGVTKIYSYDGEILMEEGNYEFNWQFYQDGKEGVLVTNKDTKEAKLILSYTK